MRAVLRLAVLLVLGLLLGGSACPGAATPGAGGAGSAIGRACRPDTPREVLAAEAIASAYGLGTVRDLQLVESGQAGMPIAVYRLDAADARPQELFAATMLEQTNCMAVIAQGDACDPLAFSPIYLPHFPEGSIAVEPAARGPWAAVDEPVVTAGLVADAADAEPGFPAAHAAGRCVFHLATLPDGRPVPAAIFSWTSAAFTVEHGRDGKQYTTEAQTTVRAEGLAAPHDLVAESQVVDVACADVDDRRAACVEQCMARQPAAGGTDVPDTADACDAECAAVATTPGRSCVAIVDRVTEQLAARVRPEGGLSYAPDGQEETRADLDADCILHGPPGQPPAATPSATPLVDRVDACGLPARPAEASVPPDPNRGLQPAALHGSAAP